MRPLLVPSGDSAPLFGAVPGRAGAACVLGAALLLFVGRARAQTTDDHQRAVTTFQDARGLIDAHHCDQAVPKLQASLTFEPSIGANLSLAECYETVDALAAWKALKEAERLAYIKHDERLGAARTRAAALEPKLAIVRVTLSPATVDLPGLEVRIDGTFIDRFFYGDGGALAVYAGKHRLAVTAPAKAPWGESFEAVIGHPVTAEVQLEDASPTSGTPSTLPPPPSPPPPPTRPPMTAPPVRPESHGTSTPRTVGLVVGGIGVAGLVLGAVTGSGVLLEKGSIDSLCPKYPTCSGSTIARARSDDATATALATVSEVSFIAGAAAVVMGAVFYFTAPRSNVRAARLRVVPIGVGGGGLEFRQTW